MSQPKRTPPQDDKPIAPHGRDEMNLCEFPFATLRGRGDSRKEIEHTHWFNGSDGVRHQQRWIVEGGTRHGLPNEFAERVFVALMAITAQQQFASPKVPFSVYRVLKIMGIGTGKKDYENVRDAIRSLNGVTITTEWSFWDNQQKELVKTEHAFKLLDRYWLRYREKGNVIREEVSTPAYIVWSATLWKSFLDNYIKPLDLQFFYSLESPLARRLYRLLDKRFYNKGEYEVDIFDLAGKLGMVRYEFPAKVIEKLQPAMDELVRRGFLVRADVFKKGAYTRIRFVRVPKNLWQRVIAEMEKSMSRSTFATWFANVSLVSYEDGVVTLGVPGAGTMEWLENKHRGSIEKAFHTAGVKPSEIQFMVNEVAK